MGVGGQVPHQCGYAIVAEIDGHTGWADRDPVHEQPNDAGLLGGIER